MEDTTTQLRMRQAIMRRVYYVYALRLLKSPLAFKVEGILVLSAVLAYLVSIPNILANMATVGFAGTGTFVYNAIISTEFAVQITIAIALCLFLFAIRDLFLRKEAYTFA